MKWEKRILAQVKDIKTGNSVAFADGNKIGFPCQAREFIEQTPAHASRLVLVELECKVVVK